MCTYFASATSNMCCNNLILRCGAASTAMNDYVTFDVFMLNYYDLGLLRVGLKSFVISIDYRDYMGLSVMVRLCK